MLRRNPNCEFAKKAGEVIFFSMSVADAFIEKHLGVSRQKTYTESTFGMSRRSRMLTSSYLNPRQVEEWELQRMHQDKLNYLHFKHRMENKNQDNFNEEEDFEVFVKSTETSQQEIELIKQLSREKELLVQTKIKIGSEVDKLEKMLKKFREQREKRRAELRKEYKERREYYEADIASLRAQVVREANINITYSEKKGKTIKKAKKEKQNL